MSAANAPSRIIVSFRVGLALALANVICAALIAWAWVQVTRRTETIDVKGSARMRIQSDLVIWRGTVSCSDETLEGAYRRIKEAVDKTVAYVRAAGVSSDELTVGAVTTSKHFQRDAKGNETQQVASYNLTQTITISSGRVLAIAELSRKATELIEQGVLFESHWPEFIYTKLADLKIKLLANATRDATLRAGQICSNSGSTLGPVRSARMGVMQVVPANSTDVSDYGINDTSSYEKDAQAVVSVEFAVE